MMCVQCRAEGDGLLSGHCPEYLGPHLCLSLSVLHGRFSLISLLPSSFLYLFLCLSFSGSFRVFLSGSVSPSASLPLSCHPSTVMAQSGVIAAGLPAPLVALWSGVGGEAEVPG